jgi:multiphosphoryl transfer protein
VSGAKLVVLAPLAGWCLPLAEVPDEVFAQQMAGDGVAIDPAGNTVHAPCAGEIVPMQGAKHAVTIRSEGGAEILIHVGIDTVKLGGEGFELLVAPGQRVKPGEELMRFDLDSLARRARSLVTPILVASGGAIVRRALNRLVKPGDFLMEIELTAKADARAPVIERESRRFRVPFEHGLHVRPAALIAAAIRPFAAEVTIVSRGRSGNARSTISLMSLDVHHGETVEVVASGADAQAALAALESVLAPDLPVALPQAIARPRPEALRASRIEGVIASRGVALGVAVPWTQAETPVEETGGDAAAEAAALDRALGFMKEHLTALALKAAGERQELLKAHVELVQDPVLAQQANEWLRRGKSAAYAWRQATVAMGEALAALGDARMRERAADLRDLENQVIRVLRGEAPVAGRDLPAQAIILAEDLLPSQLMALDAGRIAGICLARGGATSHAAIIAASLGIPTLVAAGAGILEVAEGTPLVLDAEHGWLDIDPPASERQAAGQAAAERAAEKAADIEAAQQPSATVDGVHVTVNANVGSLAESRTAMESGADGCGLLRTEFLFLDRREPPAEAEQAGEYGRIAAAFDGRPVNVRTLDIGGDKPIAYLPLPREDNPALGLRGVRTSLWRPDLLRTQLRAIMAASSLGQCRILLPMVNDLEELRAVRAVAEECAHELGLDSIPPLGVMVETPAAALLAAQLAVHSDFLSIGTNDLAQYALAIDRGHAELARRLDPLHPAVLRLIAAVVEGAQPLGRSVSVCGAMGSDVDALPILIGLGVHEVSATPAMIPRLKRTVRLLDAGECRELARRALEQQTAAAVRDLALYARARARAAAQSTPGD